MDRFDEQPYYDGYRRIRNLFRKYNSSYMVRELIKYIQPPTKDQLKRIRRHPWLVLLLLKWIFLDEESFAPDRAVPPKDRIQQMLQLTLDLATDARMPRHFAHHVLFFRAMAYQQFLYQKALNPVHIARQFHFFADLPDNHLIPTKFQELHGLSLTRFLRLGLMTLVRFLDEKNLHIDSSWFMTAGTHLSANEVSAFFQCCSKSVNDMRIYLMEHDSGRRQASEYYEQSPFLRYPFLESHNRYFCVHPNLLFRCMEHFIYDSMRAWEAEQFMARFGKLFEAYIGTLVEHTRLTFVTEDKIKEFLGHQEPSVDFIIEDANSNVFVDAKAVEMAPLGKVTHDADILVGKTKVSAIKAIEQVHEVISAMHQTKDERLKISAKSNNYLIVITYRELYLGNGRTFYEAAAKEPIDKIHGNYPEDYRIPLDNMYFITVDEFERFAEAVRSGRIGLTEGLEKAKEADRSPESRTFDFHQHLSTWNAHSPPEFLKTRLDKEIAAIASQLSS